MYNKVIAARNILDTSAGKYSAATCPPIARCSKLTCHEEVSSARDILLKYPPQVAKEINRFLEMIGRVSMGLRLCQPARVHHVMNRVGYGVQQPAHAMPRLTVHRGVADAQRKGFEGQFVDAGIVLTALNASMPLSGGQTRYVNSLYPRALSENELVASKSYPSHQPLVLR